jgi:hypothetical protein
MKKVQDLRQAWDHQNQQLKASSEKKIKKGKTSEAPAPDDDELFPEQDEQPAAPADLFNDSDDSDNDEPASDKKDTESGDKDKSGDKDEGGPDKEKKDEEPKKPAPTEQDLFGDSDEESDEELIPSNKRGIETDDTEQDVKKRKVTEEGDSD